MTETDTLQASLHYLRHKPARLFSILITTFTFAPQRNGVSMVADAHARGLAALGHKVTVVTGVDPSRRPGDLPEGVRIAEYEVSGNANLRVGHRGDVRGYQDFVASFQGDAILCHGWQTWSTDLAVPTFAKIPAVKILISHGFSAQSRAGFPRTIPTWLAWRPYVWTMPERIRSFNHVVFLTDRKDMDRFYDRWLVDEIEFNRWSVIPNGTYPKKFERRHLDFRELHGLGQRSIVLSVSNYDPLKNQELVLRAFAKANVEDVAMVFIGGKKTAYLQNLEGLAGQLGTRLAEKKKAVIFLSGLSQEAISAAYVSANVFVAGSRTEVQPLVILDAMASGTPYISTDVGCVSELPGGVVVKDEDGMASWLDRLITNPPKLRSLSEDGKRAICQKYSWGNVISHYDKLLDTLIP